MAAEDSKIEVPKREESRPSGAGSERPSSSSRPSAFNAANRKKKVVEGCIDRVMTKAEVGKPLAESADPSVDIFIKAKLKEWDADDSGSFSREEVEKAMQEWKQTLENLAKLKWKVIYYTIALGFVIILALSAIGIAYYVSSSTSVSGDGALTTKQGTRTLVTTENAGVENLGQLLSFDGSTNAFTISDMQLRDMDAVSFTVNNGTFYHFKIAGLSRFDSWGAGNDELDITTVGGHQLRMFQGMALEIKWLGTSMWEILENTVERQLSDPEGHNLAGREEYSPFDDGPMPPPRLLSKGGGGSGGGGSRSYFVGSTFVHSRGLYYSCRPGYQDGVHDFNNWCDHAGRFSSLAGGAACLVLAAFCLRG